MAGGRSVGLWSASPEMRRGRIATEMFLRPFSFAEFPAMEPLTRTTVNCTAKGRIGWTIAGRAMRPCRKPQQFGRSTRSDGKREQIRKRSSGKKFLNTTPPNEDFGHRGTDRQENMGQALGVGCTGALRWLGAAGNSDGRRGCGGVRRDVEKREKGRLGKSRQMGPYDCKVFCEWLQPVDVRLKYTMVYRGHIPVYECIWLTV